jgi:predicted PurR-regulated permease PerM
VLVVAALGWAVLSLALQLPLVTVSLALAALLAALSAPLSHLLRRVGLPPALAAALSVLTLLAVLVGIGAVIGFRATATLRGLTFPVAVGLDRVRSWLTEGPLGLDDEQVSGMRDQLVTWLYAAVPSPAAGAQLALEALGALVLVAFVVFFLLKDGEQMWAWLLERVPGRRRGQVDGAGRAAWGTLSSYVRGVVVVAVIDAAGIGAALFVLDVPLWVSLTLLTFLGAFVPLVGATVSGAVAILVTLVTNGFADAVVVLVVVLVVQQLEGNVLLPLIMSRAVHLHAMVVLVAVTAGALLFGIPGALFAVPLLAVTYRVVEHVRLHPAGPAPALPAGGRP